MPDYDSWKSTDPSDQPTKDAACELMREEFQQDFNNELEILRKTYKQLERERHAEIYGEGAESDWEPEA